MKNFIKYIIVICLTLAVGVGIGFFYGRKLGYESGKRAGIETGKQESAQEIAELNQALDVFYPPLPEDIRSISGKIKSIAGNLVEIEIASLTERVLPGKEPKKEIRKVTIGKDTKMVKIDLTAPLAPPTAEGLPAGPAETPITLADLKIGDTITAGAQENIKTKQEFNATEIKLLVLP